MILPAHRMFANSLVEFLTLSNPWLNTGAWAGIALYCFVAAFRTGTPTTAGMLTVLLAFAAWTLFEYLFHRFVMHHSWDFWHVHHHESPQEKSRNMVPLAVSLPAGAVIAYGLLGLLPPGIALFGFGSFAVAFAGQDVVHYMFHNSSVSILARLRALHMHHHFGNPNTNYGVVTNFWDWLFHTGEFQNGVR